MSTSGTKGSCDGDGDDEEEKEEEEEEEGEEEEVGRLIMSTPSRRVSFCGLGYRAKYLSRAVPKMLAMRDPRFTHAARTFCQQKN